MTLVQIIVLSLIQGLTEFLPISSSAHLILGSRAFGWPDQGLVFDVATHFGTLLAVLVYFRRELSEMFLACIRQTRNDDDRQNRKLAWVLVVATLPALVFGFLASDLVERHLRDVRVIAASTIAFGFLLWWADAVGRKGMMLRDVSWGGALFIGLAQALALVPGTSRSGITITAGRLLGLDPVAAARFSFLLAVPVIAAAGGYGLMKLWAGEAGIDGYEFALAVGSSAIAGWMCIAAFLALVRRIGLLPFVLYRLALGCVLAWMVF